MGRTVTKKSSTRKLKKIKELIKAHRLDCKIAFFSSPTLRSDNKKLPTH